MDLKITRTIIKSIVDGTMAKQSYFAHKHTGLLIPRIVPAMTSFDTQPESSWESVASYKEAAKSLMSLIEAEKSRFK